MKLTILLAGENAPSLQPEFGFYADKFVNMFSKSRNGFTFETIKVHEGEMVGPLSDIEGIIVTGSKSGVYDDLPWMQPLRDTIVEVYQAQIPMVGICFGHQIMADALGGKVVKSEKGWGIGRHIYDLENCPTYFAHPSGQLAIAASHQDQVVEAPAGATVFLRSEFTPNAGLIYANGKAMSIQPHPEFEIAFSENLIELRRGNPLGDHEVQLALDSLKKPLDNDFVGNALGTFFLQAAGISVT